MKRRYNYIIFLIFLVPIIVIFVTLIFASNSDENNRIYLKQDKLVFDSLIYDEIELLEINKIELLQELEINGYKNGVGFTNNIYFSGDAKFREIGECRAYIYHKNNCYILVSYDGTPIIFNFSTKSETIDFYYKLIDLLKE